MAGLTDMEELVATVSDKDVANFLREALACYGAGAHRACVVLCHIALFDGLRRKVKALAPVNSVAKAVSDAIEPLVSSQKVFETPLIQKLRAAALVTELEAQLLEQLNQQRNKAAHPSGHIVTAEEARFVFSETIQKFLSQPIRATSYIVDQLIGKIGDKNFFPSANIHDMRAVVEQEIENLDTSAMPFLMTKLVSAYEGPDPDASRNSLNFLLALAWKQDDEIRKSLVKTLIGPKSSDDKNAEFFSMLVSCDPKILMTIDTATKLRCRALLQKNAETQGVNTPFLQLRNPARMLGNCLTVIGEQFMLIEMTVFTDWVIDRCPYAPEFIQAISSSPTIFGKVFSNYVENAGSPMWDTSKPVAAAAPAMDEALANAISDEQAFAFVVAFVRGAHWNGFGPMELANNGFATLPRLKMKSIAFAASNSVAAQAAVHVADVNVSLSAFMAKYLP
jgi:hypothetical protein